MVIDSDVIKYNKEPGFNPKRKPMTKAKKKKLINNLWKFTAPVLAIFFGQLAMGVKPQAAGLVAIYAFYAAMQDYLKKVK